MEALTTAAVKAVTEGADVVILSDKTGQGDGNFSRFVMFLSFAVGHNSSSCCSWPVVHDPWVMVFHLRP